MPTSHQLWHIRASEQGPLSTGLGNKTTDKKKWYLKSSDSDSHLQFLTQATLPYSHGDRNSFCKVSVLIDMIFLPVKFSCLRKDCFCPL